MIEEVDIVDITDGGEMKFIAITGAKRNGFYIVYPKHLCEKTSDVISKYIFMAKAHRKIKIGEVLNLRKIYE